MTNKEKKLNDAILKNNEILRNYINKLEQEILELKNRTTIDQLKHNL